MPRVRTAAIRPAALVVPAALAALAVLAGIIGLAAGCGGHEAEPLVAPSDVHLATDGPSAPVSSTSAATASSGPLAGSPPGTPAPPGPEGDRLEAVRTVALYCALIDRAQFARAAELCARRRLWSRRALAGVARLRFRSARVYAAPDSRTLVLKARVRVRAGRGRPLPDGLAVLFFTLGRAGTAAGGWLITAVSTSP